MLEFSCKRYLVIMAASSPRLDVIEDVDRVAVVAVPRCSSEDLVVLD